MKKIVFVKAYIALQLLLLATSCGKDMLNITDPNSYNYDVYFNTPAEIREGTNAIYAGFYNNNMMNFEWPEMFDVLANEATPTQPALANEPAVSALWLYQYQ